MYSYKMVTWPLKTPIIFREWLSLINTVCFRFLIPSIKYQNHGGTERLVPTNSGRRGERGRGVAISFGSKNDVAYRQVGIAIDASSSRSNGGREESGMPRLHQPLKL